MVGGDGQQADVQGQQHQRGVAARPREDGDGGKKIEYGLDDSDDEPGKVDGEGRMQYEPYYEAGTVHYADGEGEDISSSQQGGGYDDIPYMGDYSSLREEEDSKTKDD